MKRPWGMTYDCPVDLREADRLLHIIAPPTPVLSWLKAVWEPGDFWQPVHRLFIYQMVPRARINPWQLELLLGPNPRAAAYYDGVLGRFVGGQVGISMRQWLLFRETGCLGIPFWVVQGEAGGHRYRLDEIEKQALELHGLEGDTPQAGELPFAAIDRRVVRALGPLDELRNYKAFLDLADRNPDLLDRDEQALREQYRWELFKWLETQVIDPAIDDVKGLWARIRSEAPRGDRHYDATFEQVQEDFITAG